MEFVDLIQKFLKSFFGNLNHIALVFNQSLHKAESVVKSMTIV
jgi:hypothetical protein